LKAKAFDTKLFRKILYYTKPYKKKYHGVIIFAVLLAVFAAVRPLLLQMTVDNYIKPKNHFGLVQYIFIMGFTLLFEVLSQFYFVYWANWLGHYQRHPN
jgi:ABC-type multidrug transport system fused ATPase/permease subunit